MELSTNENNSNQTTSISTYADLIAAYISNNNFASFAKNFLSMKFTDGQFSEILNRLEKIHNQTLTNILTSNDYNEQITLPIAHLAAGNNGVAFLNWFRQAGINMQLLTDITHVWKDSTKEYSLSPAEFSLKLGHLPTYCLLTSKSFVQANQEHQDWAKNAKNNPALDANYRQKFCTEKTGILSLLFIDLHELLSGSASEEEKLKSIRTHLNQAKEWGIEHDATAALDNISYNGLNNFIPLLLKKGFIDTSKLLLQYGVSAAANYHENGKETSCFELALTLKDEELILLTIHSRADNVISRHVFNPANQPTADKSNLIYNHDHYQRIHTLLESQKQNAYWVGYYFLYISDSQPDSQVQNQARLLALFYLLLADPSINPDAEEKAISCLGALINRAKTPEDKLIQLLQDFRHSILFKDFSKTITSEQNIYNFSITLLGKLFFQLEMHKESRNYLRTLFTDLKSESLPYIDAAAYYISGIMHLNGLAFEKNITLAIRQFFTAAACNYQPAFEQLEQLASEKEYKEPARNLLAMAHLMVAGHHKSQMVFIPHLSKAKTYVDNDDVFELGIQTFPLLPFNVAEIAHSLLGYILPKTASKKAFELSLSLLPNLLRSKDFDKSTIKIMETYYLKHNNSDIRIKSLNILISFYLENKKYGPNDLARLLCSLITEARLAAEAETAVAPEIVDFFFENTNPYGGFYELFSTMGAILLAYIPLNNPIRKKLENNKVSNETLLTYLAEKEIQDYIIHSIKEERKLPVYSFYVSAHALKPALSPQIIRLLESSDLDKEKVIALMRIITELKDVFTFEDFSTFLNNPNAAPYLTDEFILDFLISKQTHYLSKNYHQQKTTKIFKRVTEAVFNVYEEKNPNSKENTKLAALANTKDGLANFLHACKPLKSSALSGEALPDLQVSKNSGFPLASALLDLFQENGGNKFAKYHEAWSKQPNSSNLQHVCDVLETGIYVSSEAKQLKNKLHQLSDNNNPFALIKACIQYIVDSNLKENDTTTQKVAFIIYKLIVQNRPALQFVHPFEDEVDFNSTTQLTSKTSSPNDASNNNNSDQLSTEDSSDDNTSGSSLYTSDSNAESDSDEETIPPVFDDSKREPLSFSSILSRIKMKNNKTAPKLVFSNTDTTIEEQQEQQEAKLEELIITASPEVTEANSEKSLNIVRGFKSFLITNQPIQPQEGSAQDQFNQL